MQPVKNIQVKNIQLSFSAAIRAEISARSMPHLFGSGSSGLGFLPKSLNFLANIFTVAPESSKVPFRS